LQGLLITRSSASYDYQLPDGKPDHLCQLRQLSRVRTDRGLVVIDAFENNESSYNIEAKMTDLMGSVKKFSWKKMKVEGSGGELRVQDCHPVPAVFFRGIEGLVCGFYQ
jgi:hypothetical protein